MNMYKGQQVNDQGEPVESGTHWVLVVIHKPQPVSAGHHGAIMIWDSLLGERLYRLSSSSDGGDGGGGRPPEWAADHMQEIIPPALRVKLVVYALLGGGRGWQQQQPVVVVVGVYSPAISVGSIIPVSRRVSIS